MTAQAPPPQLGNYELLMLLASGGMANVYAARQEGAAGFQRMVVVKRVHSHLLEDRDFYDMFRDEASIASLVRHPNVVPVTDVVESAGELFLVMDYIDGVALSTLLKSAREKGARVPPRVAVRIVADALAGLHAAHEVVDMRGNKLELVHRDVSPHNILVGTDGISRLIDFGVAKAAHRTTQTRSGALKGKYPYMSPEHARGQSIDRRSDIFAAAAVLHETLTGTRLFQGENDLDTLRRVMEGKIPASSTIVAAIPPEMDAVIHKALARNVEERYKTAQDFLDEMEKSLPPATHRDVRAFLVTVCDARLNERRAALQGMMEGKVAPLSLRHGPRGADDSGASHQVVRASVPTMSPVPASKGTQIAHDTPVLAPLPPSKAPRVLGVLFLLVAAGGTAFWFLRQHTVAPVVTAHAAAASSTPPAPPPDLIPEGEVELTVVADSPIESVRANGTRRVQIDGMKAHVRIIKWKGTLPIEATLAGGRTARAAAAEGATADVHLDPVTIDAGPPAGTGKVKHPLPPPPPPPPPAPDLHPSPYGN